MTAEATLNPRRRGDPQGPSYTISMDPDHPNEIRAHNDMTGQIDLAGTDAAVVIQNAISSLGMNGGKIIIKSGQYAISKTIWLPSRIALEGEGSSTELDSTITTSYHGTLGTWSSVNVTVRSLKIAGGPSQKANDVIGISIDGQDNANIRLENVWIQSFAFGVFATDYLDAKVSDLVITNCTVSDMQYYGLNLRRVERTTVSANHIFNTGASGIVVSGRNVTISGNSIEDYAQVLPYEAGIWVSNPRANGELTRDVSAVDNTIQLSINPPNTANGIVVSGESPFDSYISKVTVVGNNVVGIGPGLNAHAGIYLHQRKEPNDLLNISNVTIERNTLKAWNVSMILMGTDIVCSGNLGTDVQVGVWSASPSRTTISDNVFQAARTATVGSDGVRLNGRNGVNVLRNRIENFYVGITEVYPGYTNGDNDIIQSNRIINVGAGGTIQTVGANTTVTLNVFE